MNIKEAAGRLWGAPALAALLAALFAPVTFAQAAELKPLQVGGLPVT